MSMNRMNRLGYLKNGVDTGHVNPDPIVIFVKQFWLSHGYDPEIREIGEALGITSTSLVDRHVRSLVRARWLCQEERVARTIRPANWRDFLK